jgi:hypothetical protein
MLSAALLIVSLLNEGHWYGERAAMVEFSMPVCGIDEPVDVEWELRIASLRLAGGRVRLSPNSGTAMLSLTTPCVRTAVHAEFRYRAFVGDTDAIDAGAESVVLYPATILDGLGRRLRDRRVFVFESERQLTAHLRSAGIDCQLVANTGRLLFERPDILIVAEDQLVDDLFLEAELVNLARNGVQIGLFRQGRVRRLLGYELCRPPATMNSEWLSGHGLFDGLCTEDLRRAAARGGELLALRVPVGDSGCPLGWLATVACTESRTSQAALVMEKRVGAGRIVAVQVPLRRLEDDPRAELLLRNMLDQLNSPVESRSSQPALSVCWCVQHPPSE